MNQTKKRLQIINIAISINDIETIQLQMLKLSSLRSDPRLQEILAGLQAQNYAQTQVLISDYIETPTEEIVQRTRQQEKETIDRFDLFVTSSEETKEETELFDFDTLADASSDTEKARKQESTAQEDDLDGLLNLTADDIMPNNIELDISHTASDDFFDISPEKDHRNGKKSHIDTDIVPKDDFFDTVTTGNEASPGEAPGTEQNALFNELPQKAPQQMPGKKEEKEAEEESQPDPIREPDEEAGHAMETGKEERGKQETVSSAPADSHKEEVPAGYSPIPYIDQKLKNMMTQYPPLHHTEPSYASVDNWLLKISNEGYTEKEVEEVISHIRKLKEHNDIGEAAQLLLVCGATESKFAQFMLARELFRGEILEKNLPEAFTLINRLAMDDYPEAICDLAQLYENGIGIGKDRKKAEALYHEAMELGVKRAAAHYERLHKANKGLLGKLFGK